jgi:release factor glutamine methyltransferase
MFESVRACLQWGRDHALDRADVLSLLQFALHVSPSWLRAHDTDQLSHEQQIAIAALLERRRLGEPVAYIRGEREFYGLSLGVDPRVLIPRPETELLVDFVRKMVPPNSTIADIGTGSGAIALALASVRSDLTVFACDLSEAALALARENGVRLGVLERVSFCQGDLLEALPERWREPGALQCIVSNPPYIRAGDPHLARGDLVFEPVNALTDGSDGLSLITRLVTDAAGVLADQAWLVLEHGFDQGDAVRALFAQSQRFAAIATHQDLAGLDRMTVGQKIQ